MYLELGIELFLQGDSENAITAFCAAITLDKNYAPAYNNLGLVLKDSNRLPEAEACFYRSIELNPNDYHAYNNLGLVLMDSGKLDQAEECFRRALELSDNVELNHNSATICNNLGTVLEEKGQLDQAKEAYCRAIQLNSNYSEAHYNLGILLKATGYWKEAENHLCRAVELRPTYIKADFALATLYLLRGEFRKGWSRYEKSRKKKYDYKAITIPHWHGEDLTGCSILLYWEYGFGDNIQFARYAQMVEKLALKTSLLVPKPLERLFKAIYPDLTVFGGECLPDGSYHYVCSLLSLPTIFNTDTKTIPHPIPFIPSINEPSSVYHKSLKKVENEYRYKVGIVWAGNPKHTNDSRRSIPFNLFSNLFDILAVQWFSLQVGNRSEEIIGEPYKIIDYSKQFIDFMETAKLIESLDLVIAVDTAVAHLAGSMGKKTWILLPFYPDWRWQLDREDSPWYPSVKLFRQQKPGDWQEVLERVKIALKEEVNLKLW